MNAFGILIHPDDRVSERLTLAVGMASAGGHRMTAFPQPAEPDPPIPLNSHDGDGGGGIDTRLRAVEVELAAAKTELKHLATRAWVLGGVVGGMVTATLITLAVIKLFQ